MGDCGTIPIHSELNRLLDLDSILTEIKHKHIDLKHSIWAAKCIVHTQKKQTLFRTEFNIFIDNI